MAPATELAKAAEALAPGDVTPNAPLAPWCSVRAGGAAEALCRPSTPERLMQLLALAKQAAAPVSLLGGGANTLVGDGGVPGLTLKLPSELAPERVGADHTVELCAGTPITRLITLMKQNGWVGAEFLAGIPGTIGGAVTMNAGTKNGECMTRVTALELATGTNLTWHDAAKIPWRYRHTELPPGVVTRVRFKLLDGDVADSKRRMEEDLAYRKRTQPLQWPNFGSVFTNPKGDHAGRLIESVGLKGHVIGKAQIAPLHANWIINLGGATAHDVTALMDLAQRRVHESTGIHLEPEVKRIGVFT